MPKTSRCPSGAGCQAGEGPFTLGRGCGGGYLSLVIWAAVLPIFLLTFAGVGAWYVSRRQLAATTADKQRRLARQAVAFSAAVGVGILIAGAVLFVITDYRWPVLAVVWAYGLLHLGLLARQARRLRKYLG